MNNDKIKIAIFASSSGSNAQKIMEHFANNKYIEVGLLLCNKPTAYVLERAKKLKVKSVVVKRHEFCQPKIVLNLLEDNNISFICLAGFFLIIPPYLIEAFNRRIVNIHPSLLPKFGGRGFYGENVHKAVIESQEKISGITIHYVDENIDSGEIIFQKIYEIKEGESYESLSENLLKLEHKYYPLVIEKVLMQRISSNHE